MWTIHSQTNSTFLFTGIYHCCIAAQENSCNFISKWFDTFNVIRNSLYSIWWALPFYQATVPIEFDFFFPMEAFIIYLTEHIVLYGLNIFYVINVHYFMYYLLFQNSIGQIKLFESQTLLVYIYLTSWLGCFNAFSSFRWVPKSSLKHTSLAYKALSFYNIKYIKKTFNVIDHSICRMISRIF